MALTATEEKVLNDVSKQRNGSVLLGDLLNTIFEKSVSRGTPVNAVAAFANLNISGVVKDGETVTIGTLKYEFVADTALSVTTVGNIPVDINSNTAKAAVVLTLAAQPTAGETITIGTKVYTWVPVGTDTADGEISVGADLAEAKVNLVAAINGTDTYNLAHPLVNAADFTANTCTITALIGGTAGNTIASTETMAGATNAFAAATLLLGTDCSASNGRDALIYAINDSPALVSADSENASVLATALVAGVSGNSIITAETMANGAWSPSNGHLNYGVDGTVGLVGQIMVDNSYLYISKDENTVAGDNWRRISIGSAF